MKKLGSLILVAAIGYAVYTTQRRPAESPATQSTTADSTDVLARAFAQKQSNVQVQATGVVERMLSDDNDGSRHQRFIVRLSSGQTILIAHNIDLASRVSPLAVGDEIQFSGEYEWNNQGGVVHWTHRDPGGKHEAGWIRRDGQLFQ